LKGANSGRIITLTMFYRNIGDTQVSPVFFFLTSFMTSSRRPIFR